MSNLSEWIKTCDELEARCNELKDENAHLRAEVDNLRKNADISPSQSPHEITRLKAEVERLTRGGDFLLNTFLWTDEYSNDRYNDAKEKWLTAKTGKQPWQR